MVRRATKYMRECLSINVFNGINQRLEPLDKYQKKDEAMKRIFMLVLIAVSVIFSFQLMFASSAFAARKKVIIGYSAKPDKGDEDNIRIKGGKVKHRFDIIPAIAAEVDETDLKRLEKAPKVKYIEPDYAVQGMLTPDDPRYSDLWGLNNIGQTGGVTDADIDAPEAWDVSIGSSNVVVAVIDSGVDYNHADLKANMWINTGEEPGDGKDNDGNGYIDDIYGYDFYNNDANPMDDHSHGTHCSGTIAAVGDNGIGVVGVNWTAKIMALKFLSSSNSGYVSGAVAAIQYVTNMKNRGVNVIAMSNSWGTSSYSISLKNALASADAAGVLCVAAAGNYSRNNDTSPFYPASYDLPGVISVSATSNNDSLASFSSYGPTSVDLAAPGVSILSTTPGGGYGYKSGTSMATPHVAGAAALIKARFPGLTYMGVKDSILGSVDYKANLEGKTLTGGRLNIRNALGEEPAPPIPPTNLVATAGDQQVSLDWDGTGGSFNVYRRTVDDEFSEPIAASVTESAYFDSDVENGITYYYVVTALNAAGLESSHSNEVSATPVGANILEPPTGLTASAGDQQVELDWNNHSDAVTYNVYRSTTSGNGYSSIATAVSESSYTDTAVDNETTYYYVVTACYTSEADTTSDQESEYSNEASATPAGPAVDNIMYVEDISFSAEIAGRKTNLYIHVKVVDGSAKPLSNVEVHMALDLGRKKPSNLVKTTGPDGVALFSQSKAAAIHYTATVTDLILAGYTWNTGASELSDSCDLGKDGVVTQGEDDSSEGASIHVQLTAKELEEMLAWLDNFGDEHSADVGDVATTQASVSFEENTPPGCVAGSVSDPYGQAIPGALVIIMPQDDEGLWVVEADDAGEFFLGDLPSGKYWLITYCTEYDTEDAVPVKVK